MPISLSINSESIQHIYVNYTKGFYLINRRYQRKLVWSIEEKEKFIDSIMKKFPIPMILTAHSKKEDENHVEILDGMQRLNSIISFIENEFPVNGKFFDLSSTAQTKKYMEENLLIQKDPKLSLDECNELLSYPIPFSIYSADSPEKLDEIFRRINTGGKTLSQQDVRQAGATGDVVDVINSCSAEIRGDCSHSNYIDIRNIKNISISNKKLQYGINIDDIFWVKNNIISNENIRSSRDEELVAYIISYIIDENKSDNTSYFLNSLYKPESQLNEEFTLSLNRKGLDNVNKIFSFIIHEIESIISHCGKTFSSLIYDRKNEKSKDVFQIIFIGLYKIIIKENRRIVNYMNLSNSLDNCFNLHLKSLSRKDRITKNERESLSDSIAGLIRPHTSERYTNDNPTGNSIYRLDNILTASYTEQNCYDFKICLTEISAEHNKDVTKVISKIVKTISAMINSTKEECYIILGITNDAKSATQYEEIYNATHNEYKKFFIFGVDEEVKTKFNGSMDQYEQKIISQIEKEPISESLKINIKRGLVSFLYYGKTIYMFKIKRISDNPEAYDEKFYIRSSSHNDEIKAASMMAFMQNFNSD